MSLIEPAAPRSTSDTLLILAGVVLLTAVLAAFVPDIYVPCGH